MIDWTQKGPVLAFFAHPDDETLSAGATLSKLRRLGVDVHVAIPATGIHSRRAQQTDLAQRERDLVELRSDCAQAMGVLGIDEDRIHLGDFPDNEMDGGTLLEVIHWLEDLMARTRPHILFTHHRFCTNVDHRYCHEAAMVAARPMVDSHVSVLCGEVPSSTGYLRPANWEPNLYVSVTSEDVERKVQAMESYRGEMRPDPHPRSPEVLRALAKVRGSEGGVDYAEAFMVGRVFG